VLILLLGRGAAFALSRYRFSGRGLVLSLFALGLILPLQSYFIAQSSMFTLMGITDTRLALILPYTAMGLSLACTCSRSTSTPCPRSCSRPPGSTGRAIASCSAASRSPLLRPGLATVAIFSALAAWNEFLLALLYIQDDSLKTIPTGLLAFSTRYVTDYSLLFSALSIVTIPMIVIYVVFNRQIVAGITAGSVK
jgi:raffinose/stachyose/melibiose transport system permease protein